jgi:cyclic-di-GMP-binding protein
MTMAKTESFDISTGVDLQEVDNALNQVKQELTNRYDFKGVLADVNLDRAAHKVTIHTADDYKLESIWQVVEQRLRARKVPLKNMQRGTPEKAAGSTVRQEVKIAQSIDTDTARKIVKYIKEKGYKKVQTQIQGDEVRVSAPSRDELQGVMKDLRDEDWGIELKFGNYR